MYGRCPRCKRNLTISEAFGRGHVFGLCCRLEGYLCRDAAVMAAGPDVIGTLGNATASFNTSSSPMRLARMRTSLVSRAAASASSLGQPAAASATQGPAYLDSTPTKHPCPAAGDVAAKTPRLRSHSPSPAVDSPPLVARESLQDR